ncbi:MAG TPA: hypothetical protein VGX68_14955 [Thermoanaerobaculia bacterium]|jgi:hypothetical protein|nr:hypothetical protein [Thermoanaerobaculia bacterium]
METKRTWGLLVCSLALLALAAVPLGAAESVQSGADLWQTTVGFTFTSFAQNPIPAGFFCASSQPFKGTINMKGVPLATSPAGALADIDTIVRRLDGVAFNEKGEGTTRIQVMALSLASVKPLETECGSYDVAASLTGEQPLTEMKIVRTGDNGGYYIAPLDLNVKLVFTPVSGKGERRELTNQISLGPGTTSVWAYAKGGAAKLAVRHTGTVQVDTDGDRQPDTPLPAPSNFVAGVDPAAVASEVALCPDESCHCCRSCTDPYTPNWYCDHLHCVKVWVDCTKPVPKLRYGPIPVEDTTGSGSN